MLLPPAINRPAGFHTAAVRHLAWMCSAPQLLSCDQSFVPAEHLPPDALERLILWDNQPASAPQGLTSPAPRRLGHYFEALYRYLLENLFEWEILTTNLQIQKEGRTLGELDFLVRNPASGRVEHHEIAVKFYLGVPQAAGHEPLWYGPNARDRLDLKTHRLLDHQCRMSQRPETRELLESLGLPIPTRSRVFMPGYLFSPRGEELPVPSTVPADHLRGCWCYVSELNPSQTLPWVVLNKPHWLGPWTQHEAPDTRQSEEALDIVRKTGTPKLFAELQPNSSGDTWQECNRWFVVPDSWPGIK